MDTLSWLKAWLGGDKKPRTKEQREKRVGDIITKHQAKPKEPVETFEPPFQDRDTRVDFVELWGADLGDHHPNAVMIPGLVAKGPWNFALTFEGETLHEGKHGRIDNVGTFLLEETGKGAFVCADEYGNETHVEFKLTHPIELSVQFVAHSNERGLHLPYKMI